MKTNFLFLTFLIASTLFIGACKDEEDDDENNNTNWAAAVEGNYAGSLISCSDTFSTNASFTRLGDKKLSLDMFYNGATYCLNKITLISATTFTIAEFDTCFTEDSAGNGSFSGNNVTFSYTLTSSSCVRNFNGTK